MRITCLFDGLGSGVDRNRFIARVFLGISLSILLHILGSIGAYELGTRYVPPEHRPVTVEWIEPSDIKKEEWQSGQQIVRQADLPPDRLKPDADVRRRFLSEERQTVDKETRALKSGLTENRGGTEDRDPETQPKRQTRGNDTLARLKPQRPKLDVPMAEDVLENAIGDEIGDIVVAGKKKRDRERGSPSGEEILLPSDPRRDRGVSTSGEQFSPDMQVGEFTALNTDRFRFYSYYARIEEQIRHRWVKYVKAAIYGGDTDPSKHEYLTKIEIVLDRTGQFIRAIIHDASGSKSMDAAPVNAFREAKRIPHPPREMVKDDGTIRLMYAFHVDQVPALARRYQREE